MQSPIQVADIDDVSSKFDQLFRSPLNKTNPDLPQLEIRTLPLTLDYAVHESDGDPSIASVYDELLRTYIAPLPRKIPPQLRQAKEKLARLISADLLLASSKIHVIETQQPIAEETQAESMETTELTLPVRSSGKSKMRALSEPRSMNSQPDSYNQMSAFPTPDPTPSLASGSTFTSSTQGLNDTPYARLRQHLHITKAHGFAQSDQDALNQVLLHWKHNFGQNPSSYEWEATTKIIHESMTSNDDDNMTATQRARLQRKAERHLKRQRRETAAAEAASSMRPFATIETKSQFHSLEPVASQRFPISPSIPLKSSPGPFRNETSQNKQESSQPAISTQVERGVFGGRPERKKKKKKKGQLPGFR
jgi:RNA polymerase I-specific transcription initiation factor RRN6